MIIRVCLIITLVFIFSATEAQPVRFLLTFDDGPSTRQVNNPTELILDVLATNSIQNNIKALFFTQTNLGSGEDGSLTEVLLRREYSEGHLLAIHRGVLKRHYRHTGLSAKEMDDFLINSQAVLKDITGNTPQLIRPTYWAFNESTLTSYKDHNLYMLLTDVNVYDGKSWGFRANPRRRYILKKQMQNVQRRIKNKEIKMVDGWLPLIVTFHDTNTWTATHMQEYLSLLIEAAESAGIELSPQPFFVDRAQIEKAAISRASQTEDLYELVPKWWQWFWAIFGQ